MPKLTFWEALERINEQRTVDPDDVQARALQRKVWIAEWHIPGCLSESFAVLTTKRDALAEALQMCDHAHGARADLQRFGRTDKVSPDAYVSAAITTIERRALATLF